MDKVLKKYIDAILMTATNNELDIFCDNLRIINLAFQFDKFRDTIQMPTLKNSQKVSLILSICDNKLEKFENFIKILGKNRRLSLLPKIYLNFVKNIKKDFSKAVIFSNKLFEDHQILKVKNKFDIKFNNNFLFDNKISNKNGIKVELSELDLEVSFSVNNFKNELSKNILKSIGEKA